uniref:cytochrome c oxidase subunit II n=1 Tax=Allonothrus sinicus TaxID=3138099 RepID=UPI00315DAA5E
MPTWMSISFQDSTSPTMEQLLFFHDHSMIVLILIIVMTLHLLGSIIINKTFHKFMMEGQEIETIWTILPAVLLLFIALPSMKTLYLMEDTKSPSMTIKVNGHQWYWSYEYSSFKDSEVDMFMENSNTYRLLKTSDIVYIPILASTRALITSSDVIHAWTVPSMGVKVDALPGRLNQTFISSKRLGLFSGQCSEICGMNHSFMPIMLQSVSVKEFISKMKEES